MRYIDIESNPPSVEWVEKAERLTQQLVGASSNKERKRIIDKSTSHWKDFKSKLSELSHGKCWYSEAREIVSDYHVDHFRPKGRALQLDKTERDGYWWLAFDWRNYRLSGSICNSPHGGADKHTHGKWDYFPLKAGSSCATSPSHDLSDELFYLLDPTDPDDPSLLTFDETGKPVPAADDDTWEYERASVTIDLLHLEYTPLVNERKKVWNKCIRLINEAQNKMREQAQRTSVTTKARIKHIFMELREMIASEAELSSVAQSCLLSSGYKWARKIVSG